MNAPFPIRRIVFHDYGGHAFTAQLARATARAGHAVSYVSFAEFPTPKGRVASSTADPPGFEARQISLGQPFDKDNLFRRGVQQLQYADLLVRDVMARRPDVVVSSNAPLEVQARLMRACRQIGARFVFWLQDLHSEAVGRILARKNAALGSVAGWYYRRLEQRLLMQSDHIVAIAPEFVSAIGPKGWGVPAERISLIENWAPLEDMPLCLPDNDWAAHHYRSGRKRIVYFGTLARKHDPELLVTLAANLDADVHLFSVGSGAAHVAMRGAALGLTNLFVRPWVAVDDLPKAMAGADVLCAFIESDAGAFSVPSKVLSYLAAGRPILASIPETNLATRTITAANAGLISAPGDDVQLVSNARRLLSEPVLRQTLGQSGRYYAERNFDIERIAGRFHRIISELVAR